MLNWNSDNPSSVWPLSKLSSAQMLRYWDRFLK